MKETTKTTIYDVISYALVITAILSSLLQELIK